MQHFVEDWQQKTMIHLLQRTGHFWFKVSIGYVVTLIHFFTLMSLEAYASRNNIYYVRNTAVDDVFLAEEQIASFEAKTEMMCLTLCNQNERCQSVSFNSLSMKCQFFLVAFWNRQNVIGTNESGWLHYDPFKAADCTDLYKKRYTTGIYTIVPGNVQSFIVKCEMDVDGGGWTVIQHRFDGTVDFQRTWMNYKSGFGDLNEEFWLGNDRIHAITTSANYELRIDISDWHGNSWYAVYKTFRVANESSQYKLTIGDYSGNAGDSMAYHNGMRFSTLDRDNDLHITVSCSRVWGGNGGWWYNDCDKADLNGGEYGEDNGQKTGTEWENVLGRGTIYTLKTTRMMIRRL